MSIQNRFTSAPVDPPEVRGQVRVFRSRAHLVAWHDDIHDAPSPLLELAPLRDLDVSRALGSLASEPRGGVLYLHSAAPEVARRLRSWVADAEVEHQPGALAGPYPVRVGDEAPGFLVGVTHNATPTFWDALEPDGWPVIEPPAKLDPRRVERLVRTSPFAAPVGVSAGEHASTVLVGLGAKRAFRGALVPTVAGLVALGEQPERQLPGLAVALRRAGDRDRVLTGSILQLCERVTSEARWWGGLDREAAHTLLVLAFAERAWAGEHASTPITVTRTAGLLTLAVPCAPANAREREDRAPANPRLRQILARLGELPGAEDGLPDNDLVLAALQARLPGARCRWGVQETWLEVPVEDGTPGVVVLGAPVPVLGVRERRPATPAPVVVEPPVTQRPPSTPASPVSALPPPTPPPPGPPAASPSPPSRPPAPTPKPRRLPPILHPRPQAPAAPPLDIPSPLPPPPPPPAAPAATPAAPPPPTPPPTTGPLTLEERKSQLRDLFSQADRPLGAREVADTLGVHRDTLRSALSALVAEGWLITTDPNPRSPVQRYRRATGQVH